MSFNHRDRLWLLPVLVTSFAVYGFYLATNPYPAHGAGLYTLMAERIIANGYGLPSRIPFYTLDGIPFAYPPLALYGIALGLDMGVAPFTLARVVPGLLTITALVPVYFLGVELLDSRPNAAAAAMLATLNPQLLEWHLTAGGLVRAAALLAAMCAVYAVYRVFTGGNHRWLLAAAVLLGLTVLTHPTYTLFVVISATVFWLTCDRSLAGIARGCLVGMGGVVLASPWLIWVLSTHGPDVFLAAAGTHGGIGGGTATLVSGGFSLWAAVAVVLLSILVRNGEFLLPAWLLVVAVVFAQPRFAYLVGSFVVVAAVAPMMAPRGRPAGAWCGRSARSVALVLLVLGGIVGVGVLGYDMAVGRDERTPEFVDDGDVAAMSWVAAETRSDASVVVLGDAAEWFPTIAHRTILVAPWGVEWASAVAFDRQLRVFEHVSTCRTRECVDTWLEQIDARPDYLYLPRGETSVRGTRVVRTGRLERDLVRSPGYRRVYANDDVVVFRLLDEPHSKRAGAVDGCVGSGGSQSPSITGESV